MSIPNGIPLVYSFDRYPSGDLIPHRTEQSVSAHVSGAFLEERGLLRAALEAEAELVRRVPGHFSRTDQPAVRALAKLELERKLIDLAADPSDSVLKLTLNLTWRVDGVFMRSRRRGRVATRPFDAGRLERAVERSQKKVQPAVDALYMGLPAERVVTRIPKQSTCQPAAFAASDAIVILRHGRTEHNKLGLFTGWEDASLAKEGIAEAKRAGQLLRAHGFAVDAVYTSWRRRGVRDPLFMIARASARLARRRRAVASRR